MINPYKEIKRNNYTQSPFLISFNSFNTVEYTKTLLIAQHQNFTYKLSSTFCTLRKLEIKGTLEMPRSNSLFFNQNLKKVWNQTPEQTRWFYSRIFHATFHRFLFFDHVNPLLFFDLSISRLKHSNSSLLPPKLWSK